MEFTRIEFLRMIHLMQKDIIKNQCASNEEDLLKKLDELWSRASVDRDKIFIIGIKD